MGEIKGAEQAQALTESIRKILLNMPFSQAITATMDFYSKRHFRVIERRNVVVSALLGTEPNATQNKG